MVPTSKPAAFAAICFPRASGDGPEYEPKDLGRLEFPPRERGWSRPVFPHAQSVCVSPARAGMVPGDAGFLALPHRFPRASGDGPSGLMVRMRAITFPPRERGWSHAYPARSRPTQVSPARAGMVPHGHEAPSKTESFPRASGDGPETVRAAWEKGKFPPRERGWSFHGGAYSGAYAVSPARAGMVRR